MKISKLFFLLLLCGISFQLSAQDTPDAHTFPVTGDYKIQDGPDSRPRDFNLVKIHDNDFYLVLNGQVMRSYEIVGFSDDTYHVRQFYLEDYPREGQKDEFSIKIDTINENECFLTILFTGGSEKIHLIKS